MNKKKVKSVIFLSNYFNHHQKPFCEEMYRILKENYTFIETETMSEERQNMGWGIQHYPPYVVTSAVFNANRKKYQQKIDDADVVIIGAAPLALIKTRNKNNRLVFRYSERLLKDKLKLWQYPLCFLRWHKATPPSSNIYLLCASAYASKDHTSFSLFKNRHYKWGYFPEVKIYADVDQLIASKKRASLLWVARFLNLKHPEVPVEIAKRLKKEGYCFELNIIGTGELEKTVTQMVADEGLTDCVHLLGAMKPEEVRTHMEQSEIFLFTSDRREGWGAVLNESMNSGCAVVASHAIGSVPYLIKDKENGCIYRDGDVDDLYRKVKFLLENEEKRAAMGRNAYLTMVNEWNAKTATMKLLELAERIGNGKEMPELYAQGVCSRAEILKDDWYVPEKN
ncbi:MAG: glycosyltransferase family 4 protein [Ruminococcaceae bacterium]|nr:glycosyltransferase family 4 protein [Oscillospiraceae bacterium]